MGESESDKTRDGDLCLNFKGYGDCHVKGFLSDPSRVGHHHPKALQVMGLALTSGHNLEEEEDSDDSSAVARESRSKWSIIMTAD